MSQTEVKPVAGFRAELSGCELATLIQLTCARSERQVVRVTSYGEEGFLYSTAGRIVHATLGSLVGEEAVLCMLGWASGDFVVCTAPFPESATIQRSTEGLLALASQHAADSELDAVLESANFELDRDDHGGRQLRDSVTPHSEPRPARPSRPPLPPSSARSSAPPPIPARASVPPPERTSALPPPRSASLPPPALMPTERASTPPPRPPAPPARREPVGAAPSDPALVASVRIDAHGALLYANGSADHLAQLVAYTAHVVGLLQADFALDPFQALHAELSDLRLLMYQEGDEVVGVLMQPGAQAQELRQRLGV